MKRVSFRTGQLFESGDDDRRRVARELHDDIGQRLALLADDADRLRRELRLSDDANRHRLDSLVQQARDLSEDLRRISHALHPAILEDLGLVPALRSLTNEFGDHFGISVTFAASEVPADLPISLSTAVYRITQEALRNISKHAGETPVHVTLGAAKGELMLTISDLGVGFDVAEPFGLGLTSMRERAYLAGGKLVIDSAPGEGTTVQVQVPFAKSQAQ